MLYIENISNDPYFNLAFEEYVFLNYKNDDIVMLWIDRPSVICGCYQNIFAEVDMNAAREADIAVARRISGGGTVYHDAGNLNFTFIKSVSGTYTGYDPFLDTVCKALRRLGIPAEKNRTSDISADGFKISGNAQKVAGGRILHHGTLLFDTDISALSAYTKGHSESFDSKGIRSAPFPVKNIKEYTGMADISEFRSALRGALCGDGSAAVSLGEKELSDVNALAEKKYRSWEWLIGSNPAFEVRRRFKYRCNDYELYCKSAKGTIRALELSPQTDTAELIGKPLWSDPGVCGLLRAAYDEITICK